MTQQPNLKVRNNSLFQGLLRITKEYKQKFGKNKIKDFTLEEATEYQAACCYFLAQMSTSGVPLVNVKVMPAKGNSYKLQVIPNNDEPVS